MEHVVPPANYVLNLSNGSKFDNVNGMVERMLQLPVVRERFLATDVGEKGSDWKIKSDKRWQSKDYHKRVRDAIRAELGTPKVFSCPGKCDQCLPNGKPACGTIDFKIPVAIGIHAS